MTFLVSVVNAQAQAIFSFVNIKNDISKIAISTLIQDHDGFIWMGTLGTGVYKFDGITYTSYTHNIKDSTSLSNNRVETSFLDSKNRLWFGTENGLNLYDRDLDRFKRVFLNSGYNGEEYIGIIGADKQGNIIVGTYDLGVYVINKNTLKVTEVKNNTSTKNTSLLKFNSICITHNDKIFMGSDFGLKELDIASNSLRDADLFILDKTLKTANIERLTVDTNNNLWVGTVAKGMYRCELSNTSSDIIVNVKPYKFIQNKISSIIQLDDTTVLCSTENDGLYHFDSSGDLIRHYLANKMFENSISHNSIWSLLQDNNGRVWVGYFNSGLAVSDNLYDRFSEIRNVTNNTNSLKTGSVMGFAKYRPSELWIATDGGGIDVYNQEDHSIKHINSQDKRHYRGLDSDYIMNLYVDSQKNLWAGSWDHGVFVLKEGTRSFKPLDQMANARSFDAKAVMSFYEDSKNRVWIGTFYKGLYTYDLNTKTLTKHESKAFVESGLTSADIRLVFVDSQGVIWVGCKNGLYAIEEKENGEFDITSFVDKMPSAYNNPTNSNHILSIIESKDNNIWIGTQGAGLCNYNKTSKKLTWYNKFNGLNEENIASLTYDSSGDLWMGGNSGLTKMDTSEMTFTNYTINDGLLSNDFNFSAVFKDDNGTLYFGNYQGIDYFNPNDLEINKNIPSLHLTDFRVFNEKVVPQTENSPLNKVISETSSLTLDHTQSVFTIAYTSLNYTRPEKNSYAYYLEGYETSWNYVGHKRTATYTNLDAGNYTFKLKASNNDGVWNEQPLELRITVLPPWWLSTWAMLLYLLLFLLGVYLLNVLTKNRIKEREEFKTERLQQTQKDELNKKKIQFFTNISHEFRTPLTLILNPLKDILSSKDLKLPESIKAKHAVIFKNSDRLFRLINELMDLRKLELNKMKIKAQELNVVKFSHDVASYFQEEASRKNIFLNVDADMPDISLWADTEMLEKIMFNLLSNAIKVTPSGGAISIEISTSGKKRILPLISEEDKIDVVELTISDTGPGLEKEQISRIFERFYQVEGLNKTYIGGTGIGLELVQNFVHLHKGEIKVSSKIDEGTSFIIQLPADKSFYHDSQIMAKNDDLLATDNEFLSLPIEEEHSTLLETGSGNKEISATVLIVEDNVELADYLKLELKKSYHVLQADNGKEGYKIATEMLPDVIITDVIMPEMDGFQFCKLIKSNPVTSHIPLLMLTAKASIENRIEGLENGADAYMVKPFDTKLLTLRLKQLVTSRQLIFDKYFAAISGNQDTVNTTSVDRNFIEKLLSYVNENISNSDLNVEELAAHLSLSRSQLYRKVKALTGETVNEFIRKIRLERAKQILEQGHANISEASYAVGFTSPSYFSKCFKAHFGVLPKQIGSRENLKE